MGACHRPGSRRRRALLPRPRAQRRGTAGAQIAGAVVWLAPNSPGVPGSYVPVDADHLLLPGVNPGGADRAGSGAARRGKLCGDEDQDPRQTTLAGLDDVEACRYNVSSRIAILEGHAEDRVVRIQR